MYHVNSTELEIFAAAADALRPPNFQHLGVHDLSSHGYPLGIKIGQGTLCIEESSKLEVRGRVAQAKSSLIHPIMILDYLSLFYGASHATVWKGSAPLKPSYGFGIFHAYLLGLLSRSAQSSKGF
jgi:hypothetical protein